MGSMGISFPALEGALQVSVRGYYPAAKRDRIEDCGALAKLIRAGILKLSRRHTLLAGPLRHEQDVALLQGQVTVSSPLRKTASRST